MVKRKLRQLLWLLLQVPFFLYCLYNKVNQKNVYQVLHFHPDFRVTFTANHWLNLEKCEDLFNVIIFFYLSAKKKELGYLEEQRSLIIMDTFKSQDNNEMKRLSTKNNCELVIVPHNLTNKLQSLDISIKQAAKKLISNNFNILCANRVSKQLSNEITPGDVKVSLKMRELKPLHAK